MTLSTTEAVNRLILESLYAEHDRKAKRLELVGSGTENRAAATAIRAALDSAPGEEFLEFKEALDDVRGLRAEYECLNGGGPGWSARNKAAWAKVDELFANEDEAAYDRHQEGLYG